MSAPITLGKGVNKDLLPSELPPGYWSDMRNFRSRGGFDEKFEGARLLSAPSVITEWMTDYETLASVRWVFEGGDVKAYVWNGAVVGTRSEITRYTDGVAITSITRVGTTATVTTDGAHGRTTADVVSHYGASPSQYNATGAITVTGANTYTYVMASDPGASASPVGAYTYNVTQNFTAAGRFSGGSLNGTLIINKPANGLYYWAGDTTIPLRKFPASYLSDAARIFKDFIIQIAPTVSGVKYPFRVMWSAAAEPGSIPASFDSSDTNNAGFVPLEDANGPGIDCLPWGDTNIIYQRSGRTAQRYVGGNDVFSHTPLPGSDGLLARDCVVNTPKGQVFLTQNRDVKIHQGGEAVSIADGRIKNWIASAIPATTAHLSYLCTNPSKSEVWVVLGQGSGAGSVNYPSQAAVWNWESDTWSIFNFDKYLTFAKSASWPAAITSTAVTTMLIAATDAIVTPVTPYLGVVEASGTGFLGTAVTGTLERTGMDMGDRDTFKTPQRARWNFDGTAGNTATSYLGTSKTADGTTTWTAGTTYTIGTTDYADGRATSGRFVGVKLSTTANALSVRSVDLDITGGGKR